MSSSSALDHLARFDSCRSVRASKKRGIDAPLVRLSVSLLRLSSFAPVALKRDRAASSPCFARSRRGRGAAPSVEHGIDELQDGAQIGGWELLDTAEALGQRALSARLPAAAAVFELAQRRGGDSGVHRLSQRWEKSRRSTPLLVHWT